jgi:hypothetical protein
MSSIDLADPDAVYHFLLPYMKTVDMARWRREFSASPRVVIRGKRRRKPSTARLIAKAKEFGVDVTVAPDGTATFHTGSAATDTSDPEIELKKWIAKHAH